MCKCDVESHHCEIAENNMKLEDARKFVDAHNNCIKVKCEQECESEEFPPLELPVVFESELPKLCGGVADANHDLAF